MPRRCECLDVGFVLSGCESWYNSITELPFANHKPGECEGVNRLALYQRGGAQLWLCSVCYQTGDRRVGIPGPNGGVVMIDKEDEIEFVTCPECDNEQADMGAGVACESCGHLPMPYHDESGNLIE